MIFKISDKTDSFMLNYSYFSCGLLFTGSRCSWKGKLTWFY